MADRKFTKPSNRKLVFHKKTGKWLTPEDEKELMELEKIKREQAKKTIEESVEDLDDEPHLEDA